MQYQIKKEYKVETREYQSPPKDGPKTYEVKVLVFDQDEAMARAQVAAEKAGYANRSLSNETEKVWIFTFYNKCLEV